MDNIILSTYPLVAAPRMKALAFADTYGTRFVVASKQVLREIKLAWIEMRHVIANIDSNIRLPYGDCVESTNFLCGPIPGDLLREFISHARRDCPNEMAAAILWNELTGEWRYAERKAKIVTGSYIEFEEVRPEEGEHLVVDVHSHGLHEATFSPEDNRDDHGAMRLSLVAGNLDRAVPTTAMRLCMAGVFIPVRCNSDGNIEVIKNG